MPSKELIEKVAKAINGPFHPVPEGSLFTLDQLRDIRWQQINGAERNLCLASAQAAISTILAALQEPDQSMLGAAEGMCVDGPYLGRLDADLVWGRMLAASALGEQSE
ncbi:hypothetical protein [Brucella anthropi]|uniref:hypothetical protein n=1 Tax=Brucella anthropi TaxID=529 RepID=UPI0005B87623|nr:hypothetical protein [Brucella anthropi]KIU68400.1 hypothetical protein TR92_11025 [Brucella anthropi]